MIIRNKNFTEEVKFGYIHSSIPKTLNDLEVDFIGFQTIISEIESISSLLFLKSLSLSSALSDINLHMAFTGKGGTGKTSLAIRLSKILRSLKYLSKGHILSVTREDLVGEYVGHTAPKTKEILKKSEGGILFIDQTSQLYKANNEKDYGSESIEIILQVMERQRKDLCLIFADEKDKLDFFFKANPGISSRVGHYLHFPNYSTKELKDIFVSLLQKEGFFKLTKEYDEKLDIILNKLQNQAYYTNIRSLELISHELITLECNTLYNHIEKNNKEIRMKNILEIGSVNI
jgi:SpoVK/Ycf46/Vps4 family AAA+-type ATPase